MRTGLRAEFADNREKYRENAVFRLSEGFSATSTPRFIDAF
jgi:hypothetical protein